MKNQIYKKKLYIYLFFLTSLLISSYLGENSSGGGKLDNIITRQFIDGFYVSFNYGIDRFIESGQVHSPIFYFLIATLEEYTSTTIVSALYVLISFFIPVVFYIILKKKFREADRNKLFFLSLIFFLSPYLRSSASWVTTDNLATLFFALSLNKYLSAEKYNEFKDYLICFTYLIIATYIRQYYLIFFLFYLIKAFQYLNLKRLIILLLFSAILSVPFLLYYYLFILENYISMDSQESFNLAFSFNFSFAKSSLIFLSLYFFYTFPLYFNSILNFNIKINNNLFIYGVCFIIFLSISIYDPIALSSFGGGIFYKISEIINFKYLFYTTSFFGFIFLIKNLNVNNIIVYLCIIFAFPVVIIYQKYYDPMLLLVIIALTKGGELNNKIDKNEINLKFLFFYYVFFLIGSNIYYQI